VDRPDEACTYFHEAAAVYKAAGNISAADIALRQCSEKAATTVSCITLQVWLHPPPQTHAGGLWRDCVCVPDDVTVGCVVCYLAAWRLDRAALAFARWLGNAVSRVRPLVCGGGLRHRSQQAEAQKGDDEMFQYIYHHADTCRESPGHVRMLHAAHAKDVYNPWMQLE
jgi:hypothetical protein